MLLTPAVNLGFSSVILASTSGSGLHALGGIEALLQQSVTDQSTETLPSALAPHISSIAGIQERIQSAGIFSEDMTQAMARILGVAQGRETLSPQETERIANMISGAVKLFESDSEEELRESERILLETQAAANIGSWTWDMKNDSFVLSEQMRHVFGIDDPSQYSDITTIIENIIHPDDREMVIQAVQVLSDTQKGGRRIFRIIRPNDGGIRWIEATSPYIKTADGSLEMSSGLVRDITKLKQAEEALKTSEARNRVLLQVIPDRIFRLSRKGVILHRYKTATEPLFRPADKVVGENIQGIFPKEIVNRFMEAIDKTLSTREIQTFEFTPPSPKDHLNLEVRLIASGDEEVIAIACDITERKRAEQATKAKAIAEAARNETNYTIASMVHELNNPMAVLMMCLYYLKSESIPPETEESVEAALSSAELVSRLIRNMRSFTDMESEILGKLLAQNFVLHDKIEETIKMIRRMNRISGINLTFDIHPDIPNHLHGYVDLLEQIIINLVRNALKYAEGSPIKIQVAPESDSAIADDVRLRISISDTGIGIPPVELKSIFEPMMRGSHTKENTKSEGLGLAIVKRLLIPLEGKIWAESEGLGKGATFHFTAAFRRDNI